MDNGSPPPSCPSNADNPPTHPHLARMYYNQPPQALLSQCTSPTLQQGGFFFQNPAPPTAASMQAAQLMYAQQQHMYGHHPHHHALIQPQSMQTQCEACSLNFMQAAAQHQLHAAQHAGFFYPASTGPVQYVAPRNLPSQYSMPPPASSAPLGLGQPFTSQPQQTMAGSSPGGQVLWRPSAPPSFAGSDSKASSDIESPVSSYPSEALIRPMASMDMVPNSAFTRSRGNSIGGSPANSTYSLVPDPPMPEDKGSHHPYIIGPHLSQAKVAEIKDDDPDHEDLVPHGQQLGTKEYRDHQPVGKERSYQDHENCYQDHHHDRHHDHDHDRSSFARPPAAPDPPRPCRSNGPTPPTAAPPRRQSPRPEAFDIPFNDDQDSPPKPPPVKLREKKRESLRMDIALDDLQSKSRGSDDRAKRASVGSSAHLEATAFTITFSDDEKPPKMHLDQQDNRLSRQNEVKERLAQKHMMRRSLKKYGHGSSSDHSFEKKTPEPQRAAKPGRTSFPPTTAKDGKKYLLDKMLNVENEGQRKTPDLLSPAEERDLELRSETGTYVLDEEDDIEAQARNEIEKVFAVTGRLEVESEEEGSKTPSPDFDGQEPVIRPTQPRFTAATSETKYQKRARSAHRLSVAKSESPAAEAKTSAISKSAGTAKSTKPGSGPSSRLYQKASESHPPPNMVGQGRRAVSFVRANQTRRSVIPVSPSSQEKPSVPKSSGVSRLDGGRFSMRGSSAAPLPPPNRGKSKPSAHPAPTPQPKTPEMNAWLRRKKYNPMKAAEEDKQRRREAAVSNAPGDSPHLSARSQSFHAGVSMRTAHLSVIKSEIAEEEPECFDEQQHSPTEHNDSTITDASTSSDKVFVDEVDKLTRELGLMAEETLGKLRAHDVTLSGSQADISESGTAQDRILAQLQSAKQAMFALNNHFLRHADSTGSSHSTAPESPTAAGSPLNSSRRSSASQEKSRASADKNENPSATFDSAPRGSPTDSTNLHLQETLNQLKPYWDKRSAYHS